MIFMQVVDVRLARMLAVAELALEQGVRVCSSCYATRYLEGYVKNHCLNYLGVRQVMTSTARLGRHSDDLIVSTINSNFAKRTPC